jgi:RNase P subunit RPR2
MSGRKRTKDAHRRKNRSLQAISELSDIILTPETHSHRVRDVAARDILRLSKRHGQNNQSISRFFVCKSCESVMRFGNDSRVRIRKKSVIITCERCDNKIRRPI